MSRERPILMVCLTVGLSVTVEPPALAQSASPPALRATTLVQIDGADGRQSQSIANGDGDAELGRQFIGVPFAGIFCHPLDELLELPSGAPGSPPSGALRYGDVRAACPAAIVKNVAGQDVEKFATEVVIGQRSPTDVGQGQLEFAKADIAAHPTSLRWTADSIEKPDNPLRVFDSGRIAVVDFYEAGPVVLIGAGLYILRSHCGTPNAQLIGESE